MTQHYAMLQRNLLYTGVTRGKRLVVLVGQKKAVAIAVRSLSPEALVEAGGMVERGRLEALRECMMSGVTAPAWWRAGKWGTSCAISSMHQACPATAQKT